jgi:class 3 adenylate cyclase
MEYTAVGGSVNLAPRIEGASAINAITLSRSTYLLMKVQFSISPRGEFTLKGIQQPRQLYEVQSNSPSMATA